MTNPLWRKQVLKSPDSARSALADALGVGIDNSEVQAWVDSLSVLQFRASELRMEQGKTSRLVGAARKNGQNTEDLIAQVKQVSSALKRVEVEQEEVFDQIAKTIAGRQADDTSSYGNLENAPNNVKAVSVSSPQSHFSDLPGYLQSSVLDVPMSAKAITVTTADNDADWQGYVDAHPGATLYHDIRWRKIFEQSTQHESYYFLARDSEGNVKGILPTMHLQSRLFGNFLVSLPFVNYGGPLATHPEVATQLMAAASERAVALQCSHTEIRETAPRDDWASRTHKVTMIRQLPASDSEFEQQLRAKTRSQAKRALQTAATIAVGGDELLNDFYRVFSRNMRDLGTPIQRRSFFESILQTFVEETFLVVVYINKRPVATAFLLAHGQSLEVPWASALREYNSLSVNMLLYRRILATAIERGYTWFDFGRSSKDAPTYRFKRQWGAEPHTLHWHYWLAPGRELPSLNPDNPKYRLVINAWQRCPVWLTNQVGPYLVRNLP